MRAYLQLVVVRFCLSLPVSTLTVMARARCEEEGGGEAHTCASLACRRDVVCGAEVPMGFALL